MPRPWSSTLRCVGLLTQKTGPNTRVVWQSLASLGFQPIAITGANNRALRRHLGRRAADGAIRVGALNDPAALAAELSQELGRRRVQLSHWINVNDALTVPFLHAAKRIGLRTRFLEGYEACRVKAYARQRAYEAGCSSFPARVIRVEDRESPVRKAQSLVAKPMCGAGSIAVRRIESLQDWLVYRKEYLRDLPAEDITLLSHRPRRDVLLERLMVGTEWEIDGSVAHGELVICAAGYKHHRYDPRLGFREVACVLHRFGRSRRGWEADRDRELQEWTGALVRALGFHDGVFHIEAMRRNDGFELIEINPRQGGGTVVPMVETLTGVNLNHECARLWVGARAARRPRPQRHDTLVNVIAYPTCTGTVEEIAPASRRPITIPFAGREWPATWHPLCRRRDPVSDEKGEQYLGELHLLGAQVGEEHLSEAAAELDALLADRRLVVCRPARLRGIGK